MGTPKDYPVYWDKMLVNASQVTNPSIDPLREPMETRTYLGQKASAVTRDANGRIITKTAPPAEAGDSHHVQCHVLWIHLLQRP